MSYVVTIKRPAEAFPLTVEEVTSVLSSDAAFSQTGEASWEWRGTNPRDSLTLTFHIDAVSTEGRLPRSPEWLQALRRTAAALNARVHGEEGEEITEAEPGRISWLSSAGGLLLAAVMMPVMLLVLVVRLPWLVWKLLRATR
jgi:hypothetical protein